MWVGSHCLRVIMGVSPTLGVVHSCVVTRDDDRDLGEVLETYGTWNGRLLFTVTLWDVGYSKYGRRESLTLNVVDPHTGAVVAPIMQGDGNLFGKLIHSNTKWLVMGLYSQIVLWKLNCGGAEVKGPCVYLPLKQYSAQCGVFSKQSDDIFVLVWFGAGFRKENNGCAIFVDLEASFNEKSLVVVRVVTVAIGPIDAVACNDEVLTLHNSPGAAVFNTKTEKPRPVPGFFIVGAVGPEHFAVMHNTDTLKVYNGASIGRPCCSLKCRSQAVPKNSTCGILVIPMESEPNSAINKFALHEAITGVVIGHLAIPKL